MLPQHQNDLLTLTGPSTPGGALLRSYWQPIALSRDLPRSGAPIPLTVMSEELVLFRDEAGRLGLLGRHCSHRGTDLSYGRVEDGGLRCLYHGWLYDVEGRCLEQPAEPAGSTFCAKIQHRAYPCREQSGIVFVYMGQGDAPRFPECEPFTAPEDHLRISRVIYDCNYLQTLEGTAADPVHTSFLHRQLGGDNAYGPANVQAARGSDSSLNALYGADVAPVIETEETEFGVRIYTIRKVGADKEYVRVSNYVYPNVTTVGASTGADGFNYQVCVPIDDVSHWKWQIVYRRSAPFGPGDAHNPSAASEFLPDGRLVQNRHNRYGQNRESMQSEWYAGMGPSFNVHDAFATETQGRIQDRTAEHLGYSDRAIIAERKAMVRAVQSVEAGEPAPHLAASFTGHVVISEVVPAGADWRALCQARVEQALVAVKRT